MDNTNKKDVERKSNSSALDGLVIKPCPCGKTPTKLHCVDNGQGSKWAQASGDCCGEWSVEFRTGYFDLNSEKCQGYAIDSWNGAPRA